jgi:hypothetical protein
VEDVEEERQRERESPRQSELAEDEEEEEEEEEDGNYIVYQTQKNYNPIYVHLYVRICTYVIHSLQRLQYQHKHYQLFVKHIRGKHGNVHKIHPIKQQ